jgi:AcrR family transcriptional regulator
MSTSPHEPEPLQDRRRRYVAAEISRAAMRLFAERGFGAVTVEEIATAAGTSARTFFRYFASKDDVVLQYRRRLVERLVATVLARPPEEGAVTALHNAYLETAGTPETDREIVAARNRVLVETPHLKARAQGEQGADGGPLVAALAQRMGVDADQDDRPRLIAVAMAAVADAAFERWVGDGERGDPAGRIAAALDLVEQGLRDLDEVRSARPRIRSA